MLGAIGVMGLLFGIVMLFTGEAGYGLFLIVVGLVLAFIGVSIEDDNQKRHENDYGKVTRCYKCGSTKVYYMTYDDKRDSINFWGAASSKIGKRYHCDNCGNEW